MTDIGPGDFVECVNAAPCSFYGDCGLVHGALYRVRAVKRLSDCHTGYTNTGLRLEQHVHPKGDGWFGIHRFRPVHRPDDSSLICDLLRSVDDRVDA